MSRTYRMSGDYKTKIRWEPRYEWFRDTLHPNDLEAADNAWMARNYMFVNYGKSPSDWNRLFMQVPFRRKNKRICKKILDGHLDPEEAMFPTTIRKPYIYYW